jgi:ABC-type transport system involved in multi-copper enzyme maturation permease subunit
VRLIRAEMLKLVRRRGTMIWCSLLTDGSVLIFEVVVVTLHAVNGARHGPAGGATNLDHVVFVIGGLGNVAAILIGAAAGTQDVSAGVFRDLVVTGRPRKTLFNVRFPGALAVFVPLLAVGFGIAVVCSFVFAGDRPHPSGSAIGHYIAYLLSVTMTDIAIAIGLAAFASSRVVVGVLIAWNAIVGPLLINIGSLGGTRRFIDVAASQHLLPPISDPGTTIAMSTGTALAVLVVWVAVFQFAGRWWTQRRDA